MKVYKVYWLTIDYKNSLEYGPNASIAISSNYINPRIEKSEFYSTKELAEERINQLADAAKILGDYHIQTGFTEINIKESL